MVFSLSWRVIAFFGVWVLGSLLIGWLLVSRESLRTDLAQAQGDVALCRADRAAFAARVEEFEKAMRVMEEAEKAQKERFTSLQRDYAPQIAAHEKKSRAILAREASGLADCAAVRDLLADFSVFGKGAGR